MSLHFFTSAASQTSGQFSQIEIENSAHRLSIRPHEPASADSPSALFNDGKFVPEPASPVMLSYGSGGDVLFSTRSRVIILIRISKLLINRPFFGNSATGNVCS